MTQALGSFLRTDRSAADLSTAAAAVDIRATLLGIPRYLFQDICRSLRSKDRARDIVVKV